uniref:YwqJ-related putative deaminase n=1 Tax=Chromobacterium haemolyticum TaxID=394935 RepID=UPI001EE66E65
QQIVGSIAGDLKLESLQDTSSYHSLNQSISGSVTIGYGSGGSVSLSQQKMDADYASVQQQSGIKAGDGGFQLSVKGSTQLIGAVIAGSAASIQQDKNSLSTGALVTKDIDNHADFTASSVTVAAGSGGVTGMAMAASDHDASTTRSGISGGKLEITNNALQQALTGQSAADAVAKLNRNVDSATDGSGKLANNFDKEQVQALFDAAAALHEQVGTFLSNKAQAAKATQDALDAARKDPAASASDLERLERAAADTKADADKWAPGGAYGQILTAVTAGIGGNLANGLGGMAQNAGIAYLQGLGAQQVKALVDGMEGGAKTPEGETVRAVLHAALACGGASASGQSCGAGAAGAAAAVALNSALDQLQKTDASKMTAAEKLQRENLVSGLLAGLSTATGGASTAATTVNAAKTEMENNTLSLPEKKVLIAAEVACREGDAKACQVRDQLKWLDATRNAEIDKLAREGDEGMLGAFSGLGPLIGNIDDQKKQLEQLEAQAQELQKRVESGCSIVAVKCDLEANQGKLAFTQLLIRETKREQGVLQQIANIVSSEHTIKNGEPGLVQTMPELDLFAGLGVLRGAVKSATGALIGTDALAALRGSTVSRGVSSFDVPSIRWAVDAETVASSKPWLVSNSGSIGKSLGYSSNFSELKLLAEARYLSIITPGAEGYLPNAQRGPVLAVVMDTKTGGVFYGRNTGLPPVEDIHPLLRERLVEYEKATSGVYPPYLHSPGDHAEVLAFNEALKARQVVALDDFSSFSSYNIRLKGVGQGQSIPRCQNCSFLTDGMRSY